LFSKEISLYNTGLDPSGYRHASSSAAAVETEDDLLGGVKVTEEERFKDCERLSVSCPAPGCGRQVVLDAPFTGAVGGLGLDLIYQQNA